MKNPPIPLKEFAEMASAAQSRIPLPNFAGDNNPYLDLPLMNFSLRGQGNFK